MGIYMLGEPTHVRCATWEDGQTRYVRHGRCVSAQSDATLAKHAGNSLRSVSNRRTDFMDAIRNHWFFRLDQWQELQDDQPFWKGQFTRIDH